jgi:metallo-beta-lactamase family protein
MRLTFIGAAQEVTGSCFLVETDDVRFLVDCGMFQGGREARARNLKAWPFDPRQIDFVLLTHAHIDHSGLLPRLCALGFRGPILTTRATVDLLSVMLLDSAFIQESEWARAQRQRTRQPRADAPALLYTVAQAEACLEQLQGTTVSVLYVPDVFGITIIQGRIQDMNGVPVVGLCETPFTGTPRLVKRLSDLSLSVAILVLIAPLLLVIAGGGGGGTWRE